jgi:melanoma-associated antigen
MLPTAAKSQTQREVTSNTYILVSLLPAELRDPAIIPPSKVQSEDGEAAYMALYTTIISIIALSGGELSEPRLRRHLSRLNASDTMPSQNPNDPNAPSEKTEDVLQRMIKQGYLVKAIGAVGLGDNDEDLTTWHIGPRGKAEVTNEAIAEFVRQVYGQSDPDLESKLQKSLKVQVRAEAENAEGPPEEEPGNGDPGPSSRRRSRRGEPAEEEEDEEEEEDDD